MREAGGLSAFYLHLHPRSVRRRSLSLGPTLGLGLATVLAMVLAAVSGVMLMFHYTPQVDHAHASVQDIIAVVPFGCLLRNLHRWSAHAAVALCLLHLLRTFYWGSYRDSHRRVWLVGVGLLLLTLATSFTGYLLPWDQDAYWTVTVGTSVVGTVPLLGDGLKQLLLGGDSPGAATLVRFYALHVMVLPGCGVLLLVIHLFRLRRAGGLRRSAAGAGAELVPVHPHLIERQLVLALLVCLVLVLLSLWVHAPLGAAPDLVRPDNPPKAPWFLVGVQELASLSALWGGVVAPAALFGLLALVPWIDGGRRGRQRAVRVLVSGLLAAIVVLSLIGWFFRGPDWRLEFHPGPGRAAASALTEARR